MNRHFWLAFVIAGGFSAATGFPVQKGFGILDFYGLAFLAQFLVFVGFCGVAIAVAREAIDLRRALGISVMIWMACAALSEATVGGIRWLLPFPIIIMVTWPRAPLARDDLLSHLPDPVRQVLAVIAAVVGSHMLAGGLRYFQFDNLRFDYFEIFTGALIYGVAIIFLIASLTRKIFAQLAIGSYAASLALYSVVRLVEITNAPVVYEPMIVDVTICAMLLVQVWRHFFRPDGWLKLIETLVGGIILSLATAGVIEWVTDNSMWVIVGLPYAAFSAAVAVFALYLIWSERILLKELGRRFRTGTKPSL